MTRTDALYFTITIFATVGFGDITAVTQTARVVTMMQMLLDLIVLGLLIRLVLSAVQTSQRDGPPSALSRARPSRWMTRKRDRGAPRPAQAVVAAAVRGPALAVSSRAWWSRSFRSA